LEQEPWEVVRLPAIADETEAYRVETVLGQQSFGPTQARPLNPEREPPAMLEQIRRPIGARVRTPAGWAHLRCARYRRV
jgi:hypothetical protein